MKQRVVLFLACAIVAPSILGCSQSNVAQPAENIVTERPKGFVKGKDGKMTSDSIKSSSK